MPNGISTTKNGTGRKACLQGGVHVVTSNGRARAELDDLPSQEDDLFDACKLRRRLTQASEGKHKDDTYRTDITETV
jgi:hypothetical protein